MAEQSPLPLYNNSAMRSCGNQTCSVLLSGAARQVCSSCKSRTYCSKNCQAADWPIHSFLCVGNLISDTHDKIARKFSYKHTQVLIDLALSLLHIENLPHGPLRDNIWSAQCQRFIPLITIQRITPEQCPRGRHNSVRYISASLETLDEIDKKRPCKNNLCVKLAARHPAVAYAILVCDVSGLEVCLTTFTHSIIKVFNIDLPRLSGQFYERRLQESIIHLGGIL